jgi:Lon protease-like protein
MLPMYELPLFPLNTVLFPGMPISLTIFEDRYKEMIGYCLEMNQPFGVVLIESGMEAGGPLASPYSIGCTADIVQVQAAGEGMVSLLAVGRERFRLVSLHFERPYLVGVAETFPLDFLDPAVALEESQLLRPFVERYLKILSDAGDVKLDAGQLPNDPLTLAYLAAHLVQVPADQKQLLLSAERTSDFLAELRQVYRREIVLLEEMLTHPEQEDQGLFSVN